jgi:serine/threonine-protein kinase
VYDNSDLQYLGPLLLIGAIGQKQWDSMVRAWKDGGQSERLLAVAVKQRLITRTQALVLADAPLERNQPFERYKLVGKVGEGGMALVYEATFKELDQRVALKVLKTEYVVRPKFRMRFKREAGILLHLDHENIVEGKEYSTSDGVDYCAMGFVEGISVLDLLDGHGSLEEGLALHIATQVGEALQHMHERGVVHRDVKPDNFVVDPLGHVRMIDFGLALLQTGMREDTGEAITVGTPEYMSPEQCRGTGVDVRSDIYSLGVSLFHMITGELPFTGEQHEVMNGHVNVGLEFTQEQRSEISPPVQFVLKKTMAKDPAHRYATPREMVDDLHAVAGDLIANRAPVPAIVQQSTVADAPIATRPAAPSRAPQRGTSPRSSRGRPGRPGRPGSRR